MEKGTGFIVRDTGKLDAKMVITSKSVRYSKLELAWRIGITVAVVALILMKL